MDALFTNYREKSFPPNHVVHTCKLQTTDKMTKSQSLLECLIKLRFCIFYRYTFIVENLHKKAGKIVFLFYLHCFDNFRVFDQSIRVYDSVP